MRNRLFLTIILVAVCISTAAFGQYKVDWSCVSAGGGVSSSASYRLSATIGQPAAGFIKASNVFHWVGFWSGDVPTPTVIQNLTDAKKLSDGLFISTSGKIATSAAGDFSGFFYIEDSARANGIRISVPPSAVKDLARGSVVTVMGTLGTAANGERQLTVPMVIITATATPPVPLGMINRTVGGMDVGLQPFGQYGVTGGTGINNVGLLIKAWGKVTSTGTGYVIIDDNSGAPVRIDTTTLATPPVANTYISVVGISSLYTDVARQRLLLPRKDSDVAPY